MIALKQPSTLDAVTEFFAIAGNAPNLEAWIEPYLARLRRENMWTPAELQEIHRAILNWMDEASD